MKKYLKYLPKPLLDDVAQGHCIPIIGAGFSKNADLPSGLKMPSWQELGKYFAKLIPNYPFSTPTDAISAFAQEFSRTKLVEELVKVLNINEAKPGSAHTSFAKLHFKTVMTTNFDFLLEKAYELVGRSYWPIRYEDQLSVIMPETTTIVLKIHGDLNHPSRIIITEKDYDTFLDRYPLLSTYLSNLLISKTPLSVGYSLDDPDFRQLWSIIGNRLGEMRRPFYAILVNPTSVDIARYNRRGVKVIALPGSKTDYDATLSLLFQEIKEYWDEKVIENSIVVSDEMLFDPLSLPRDSETRLCFFALPAQLQTYYKNYIFPIVERFGFTPITATDVLSLGDNILAKISTLIDRSTFVVADVSTPAVLAEVGLAIGMGRRVLIVAERESQLPLDVRGFLFVLRPKFPEPPDQEFTSKFAVIFRKFSKESEEKFYAEPMRLLKKEEYNAAAISAIILLEVELKEALWTKLVKEEGEGPYRITIWKLLGIARSQGLVSLSEYRQLRDFIAIRNRLIHTKEKITEEKANEIVNEIMRLLREIKKRM